MLDGLGARLRALRQDRGLTLVRLGQQVHLSASYLSQVERGVTMPSLPKLTAVARALAVDVRDLFEDEASPHCVVRSGEGRTLEGTRGFTVELLSADPQSKSILPFKVTCPPGACCERPPILPGEECGLVLRGRLTVTVGDETFVLEAGDSIHYQRHQAHSWRNDGDVPCVVIWASSPPISEDGLRG